MRVALLLSGEPRFCSEFDLFLENLRGYDQVDWFVWLWRDSQCEEHRGVDVVAPSWRHLDYRSTHDRLASYLPTGHQLTELSIVDKSAYPAPQVHHKAGETSVERMWGMYNSLYQCDLTRRACEQRTGQPYDLVIRTRPDLGLSAPLDLVHYKQLLDQNPSTVVTPTNHVHGREHKTNDMMAMGLSDSMSIYCDLAKYIVDYNQQLGVIYHPETTLAFHMHTQGLKNYNRDSFEVVLRAHGSVVNNVYRSNYGRWA